MKKWTALPLASVLALGISASAAAAPAAQNAASPSAAVTTTSTKTAQSVLENVIKRSQSYKSAAFQMKINQDIGVKMPKQRSIHMKNLVLSKAQIAMKPVAVHQTMHVAMTSKEMGKGDSPMRINLDMYMTPQGVFMKDSETNKWMRMTKKQSADTMKMLNQSAQMSVAKQLEAMKPFAKHFELQQKGSIDVLSMKATGAEADKAFQKMMKAYMMDSMNMPGADMKMFNEMFKDVQFRNFEFVYYIDSKTGDVKKVDSNMELRMKAKDGTSAVTKQKARMLFTSYNKNNTIKVPSNIVKHAKVMTN